MKKIMLIICCFFCFQTANTQDFIKENKYAGDPLFDFIVDWWGTKYQYGGSTKKGIDCSAFTSKLAKEVYGVELPRTASQQYSYSKRVPKSDLKDGDLVFFRTAGPSGWHVGVYITDGWFVHSSSNGGVKFNNINEPSYTKKYRGSGRIL